MFIFPLWIRKEPKYLSLERAVKVADDEWKDKKDREIVNERVITGSLSMEVLWERQLAEKEDQVTR